MEFKIEKDVPMPEYRGRPRMYPYPDLGIGDSFFVHDNGMAHRRAVESLARSNVYWGKKLGRRFSMRSVGDGIRVWRIS